MVRSFKSHIGTSFITCPQARNIFSGWTTMPHAPPKGTLVNIPFSVLSITLVVVVLWPVLVQVHRCVPPPGQIDSVACRHTGLTAQCTAEGAARLLLLSPAPLSAPVWPEAAGSLHLPCTAQRYNLTEPGL